MASPLPTDPLEGLTNSQWAQLGAEFVALMKAAGIVTPTVRKLMRRVRAGIDWHLDKADEQAERDVTDRANAQRQADDAELRPIRERRNARWRVDYGAD